MPSFLWPRYVSSSTLASLCQLPGSCVEMPGCKLMKKHRKFSDCGGFNCAIGRMRLAIDPIIYKICCAFISPFVNYEAFVTLAKISSCCWRHRQRLRTLLLCSLGPIKTNEVPDANQGHSGHSIKGQQKLEAGTKANGIHEYILFGLCGELIFSNILFNFSPYSFIGSVTMSPIPMMIWSPAPVRQPQALGATASWLPKKQTSNTWQIFV